MNTFLNIREKTNELEQEFNKTFPNGDNFNYKGDNFTEIISNIREVTSVYQPEWESGVVAIQLIRSITTIISIITNNSL